MKKFIYSFTVLSFVLSTLCLSSQVVINEISYNPLTPNSPGKLGGVEYLELYNDGVSAVNLSGWEIPQTANNGIAYTFGNVVINAGDYLLLTNDAVGFQNLYNKAVREYTGFILNGGYRLELRNSAGNLEDSVRYDDNAPWPVLADGQGCSIELCDVTSDNALASSWMRSTNYFGIFNRRKVYGTPGVKNSTCNSTPIIQVLFRSATNEESDGAVTFDVYIDNTNGSNSSVQVQAFNGSGDKSTDIMFTSPTTISFSGMQDESMPFTVTMVDDAVEEPIENIFFVLKSPTNATLSNDTLELFINADVNDLTVKKEIKLNGILNVGGQGTSPNLIEIMALADIADISNYSLGCANNGGGTDGIEFQFPAVSVKKGESYFITRQPDIFKRFFGFDADFLDTAAGRGTTTATNFTGDDAMELFERGQVIDRYGVATVDGTGEVWEYLDSWGKRKDGTGPDGRTFVPGNWTFGGPDALDDTLHNDSCTTPYPLPIEQEDTTKDEDSTVSVYYTLNGGSEYVLYPNPAERFVKLSGVKTAREIMITNVLGTVITNVENSQNEIEFDISKFENGVYFIQIIEENNESSVLRFIKSE